MKLILKNNKIFSLIIWFFSISIIIYSNTSLANSAQHTSIEKVNSFKESEADISNQLNDYKSVSNWIYDNQDKFKQILADTAKKTKTKWILDDSSNLEQKNNNSTIEVTNNYSSEDNAYHIVKKGENLYSLSRIYNIKVKDIVNINNLDLNAPIKEGQKLLIKIQKENKAVLNKSILKYNNKNNTEAEYRKYLYYRVKESDTIYSVSKKFNVSVSDISSLNNIYNNNIYAGMLLKIDSNYKNRDTSFNNQSSDFDWPIIGRLLVNFGPQKTGLVSEGINIMAKAGSNVKTIASGVVIYVGSDIKALGNIILIQHKGGWVSVYGYLGDLLVKKGEEVKRGTIIATVAKLSNLKVSQLHFELRKNIAPKDPLEYLNSYT